MEILPEFIAPSIYIVRGCPVVLDSNLGAMIGTLTKRLNEAAARNHDRFPEDFRLQLTQEEWQNLKSQNATSKSHGGRRKLPFVYTEHGVIMMAGVLSTPVAIEASIRIVREFVRLRHSLAAYSELAKRMDRLEGKMDDDLARLWSVLAEMLALPEPDSKRLGFRQDEPA